MISNFANDRSYISTQWLIRQVNGRGLRVEQLLLVRRIGTASVHYIIILDDGGYVCDCCMGSVLGIPCRHFFQVLLNMKALYFRIDHIRPRCVSVHIDIGPNSRNLDGTKTPHSISHPSNLSPLSTKTSKTADSRSGPFLMSSSRHRLPCLTH